MIGTMESSGKVVATMVAVFLVAGGAVMLSIVRLAGIIPWPPLWAVFAVFGVLLAPLALLLLFASNKGGYSDDGDGFWSFLGRWGSESDDWF